MLINVLVLAGVLTAGAQTAPQLPAPFTGVTAVEQKTAAIWTGNVKLSLGTEGDAIVAEEAEYTPGDGVLQLRGRVRFNVAKDPHVFAADAKHAEGGGAYYRGDIRIRLAGGALLRADEAVYFKARGELWLSGGVRVERLAEAATK